MRKPNLTGLFPVGNLSFPRCFQERNSTSSAVNGILRDAYLEEERPCPYRDVPHHLDGEGKGWGSQSLLPLLSSWGDSWASPRKRPGGLCLLQVLGQGRHGGFVHSSAAALADGLSYQVVLQPEALPASRVQRVGHWLIFLGKNCL